MSDVWIPNRHRADSGAGASRQPTDGMLVMPGDTFTPNEFLLSKRIAEKLQQLYPDHLWGVNLTDGIVDIRLLSAHTGTWGYTIKHVNSYSASDLDRQIRTAGGELLERYRQRRGRLDEASLLSQRRDAAGRLIPELG
jgi:hypothetical protein